MLVHADGRGRDSRYSLLYINRLPGPCSPDCLARKNAYRSDKTKLLVLKQWLFQACWEMRVTIWRLIFTNISKTEAEPLLRMSYTHSFYNYIIFPDVCIQKYLRIWPMPSWLILYAGYYKPDHVLITACKDRRVPYSQCISIIFACADRWDVRVIHDGRDDPLASRVRVPKQSDWYRPVTGSMLLAVVVKTNAYISQYLVFVTLYFTLGSTPPPNCVHTCIILST